MFPMGPLAKIVSLIFEDKKHILVEKNLKKSHFTTSLNSSNSLKIHKKMLKNKETFWEGISIH